MTTAEKLQSAQTCVDAARSMMEEACELVDELTSDAKSVIVSGDGSLCSVMAYTNCSALKLRCDQALRDLSSIVLLLGD